MTIKMRNNKKSDAICCECGETQEQVLNMFDLRVGKTTLTICDICNEQIFYKSLNADVMKDSRIKTNRDLLIIKKRQDIKSNKE